MLPVWAGWICFVAAILDILVVTILYGRSTLAFIGQNKYIILKIADIVFDIVYFAIFIFFIYLGTQYHLIDAKWLLLTWIMLYSLALSILSTLRDFNIAKLYMRRAISLTLVFPTFIALIGFWCAFWPNNFVWPSDLILPAIMTGIFLLFFAGLGIYSWLKENWSKTPARYGFNDVY